MRHPCLFYKVSLSPAGLWFQYQVWTTVSSEKSTQDKHNFSMQNKKQNVYDYECAMCVFQNIIYIYAFKMNVCKYIYIYMLALHRFVILASYYAFPVTSQFSIWDNFMVFPLPFVLWLLWSHPSQGMPCIFVHLKFSICFSIFWTCRCFFFSHLNGFHMCPFQL